MTDKVRLAHVGVAFPHARSYIGVLLLMPEVEVVGFYDPDPAAARALLPPALQERPIYDSIGELLERERPEAVQITLSNDITPRAVIQAAEAGVHLYVEKPCARTAAEFRPAADAIAKAGVRFATAYTRRFSPVAQAIRRLVAEGLLGRPVSIETSWVTKSVRGRGGADGPMLFSKERSGGGNLHWETCHALDLFRWVTAAEFTEVAAIADTLSGEPIDVEDTAALSLRFSNGMLGSLHCSYIIDPGEDQISFGLRGTEGWVRWDNDGPEILVRSTRPEWAAAPTRLMRFDPDPIPGVEHGLAITTRRIAARRQFFASFREGEAPAFTPDDALRVLEVLDAVHESSRTGRRVPLTRHGPRRG